MSDDDKSLFDEPDDLSGSDLEDFVNAVDAEIEAMEKILQDSKDAGKKVKEKYGDESVLDARRNTNGETLEVARELATQMAGMYGIDPDELNFDILEQPDLDGQSVEASQDLEAKVSRKLRRHHPRI